MTRFFPEAVKVRDYTDSTPFFRDQFVIRALVASRISFREINDSRCRGGGRPRLLRPDQIVDIAVWDVFFDRFMEYFASNYVSDILLLLAPSIKLLYRRSDLSAEDGDGRRRDTDCR